MKKNISPQGKENLHPLQAHPQSAVWLHQHTQTHKTSETVRMDLYLTPPIDEIEPSFRKLNSSPPPYTKLSMLFSTHL